VHIDILTLFPDMLRGPFDDSIVKRAKLADLLALQIHDIRSFTTDRHHSADDAPFGGGAGQVLNAPPIAEAVEQILSNARKRHDPSPTVILLAAQGRRLTQRVAEDLATREHLVLICGHYEGVDERVREHIASDSISVGDYVLTGGEAAAIVLVDSVVRLIPGVLGASESLVEESMTGGLLEYPHYTRPAGYRGWTVPPVLLSGDHAEIARWRREESLRRTFRERPDLLASARLTQQDARFLGSLVDLDDV